MFKESLLYSISTLEEFLFVFRRDQYTRVCVVLCPVAEHGTVEHACVVILGS